MIDLLTAPNPAWEERHVVWKTGAYQIELVRTQADYELEGHYLGHCVGTKDSATFGIYHRLFSVREADTGIPHATVLSVRDGRYSEYGKSSDLGTHKPHSPLPGGVKLRVLQVRGRCDRLAKPEFIQIIADWYVATGGKLNIPLRSVLALAARIGDDDDMYHYCWLLDESKNNFPDGRKDEEVHSRRKVQAVVHPLLRDLRVRQ